MAKPNKDDLKIGVTFTPCKSCDRIEVVHGKWKTKPNTGGYEVCMKCSVCAFQFDNWKHIFSYCPVCGAKMDGDKNG
ncbi:MAG: hypothetical protein J6Q39_08170 [Bacteroidales bacterium]|nr:hypothetical protein [Bacteroidales bacterium]